MALVNGRYTVLICFFVLSCNSGEGEATLGDFLFLEKAEEQQTKERVWKSVSVNRLFELSGDEGLCCTTPSISYRTPMEICRLSTTGRIRFCGLILRAVISCPTEVVLVKPPANF